MADVAAFDFDGTLTDRGSVFGFLEAVGGRGRVLAASARLAPRLVHAALSGGEVADTTKERLFRLVLAGVDAADAARIAERFAAEHLASRARPAVVDRLSWHRERGDAVVVVSASPELYVQVAADALGADATLATRLAVDGDGRLTGGYEGANCRGEEKLRRLRTWLAGNGLVGSRLWAYGNSRGDLRLLDAADVGVNVGRLGAVGTLRAYPGLDRTGPAAR
jgi:phosphatidylglycerophosphatase C